MTTLTPERGQEQRPLHFINASLAVGDPDRFKAEAAERSQAILAKHGLSAFEYTKRAACYHEAGHSIVYAAEGGEVEGFAFSGSAHRSRPVAAYTGWA